MQIEHALALALTSTSNYLSLRNALTDDLVVANPSYLSLMLYVEKHLEQFKVLPTAQDVALWIQKQPEGLRAGLTLAYGFIQQQDISGYTPEFLRDSLVDELRSLAARNAFKRMEASGFSGDPLVFSEFNTRIQAIQPVTLEGLMHLSDYSPWLPLPTTEDRIKTGFKGLDEITGGFGPEMVLILAGSGVGKTAALMNLGKAFMLQGCKGLHITLEVATHAAAHRYYRRLVGSDKNAFIHDMDNVRDGVKTFFQYVKGDIGLIHRAPFSINTDDVKQLVEMYSQLHGDPDFVFLDYIDLLKPTKMQARMDRHEALGAMVHELRQYICKERGIPFVSPQQVTEEGMKAEVIKPEHIAGSKKKFQAADIAIAMMRNDTEIAVNQGRLKILKMRESAGLSKMFALYIALDYMMIADLDDPESRKVQDRLKEEALHDTETPGSDTSSIPASSIPLV